LAPGFYARQDIKTPVKIGLFVLVFTQLSNLVFVPLWQHAGLAFSIGLGACLNAILLWIGLARKGLMKNSGQGWLKFLTQLTFSLSFFSAVLYFGAHQHDWINLRQTPILRIMFLCGWSLLAASVYFLCLWITGLKFKEFLKHSN
jgi:putative peptidoglycan lipid II flippase